jgi:hypothetical protein
MDFTSINGSYFVIRLVLGLIIPLVVLVLMKPSTRLGFIGTVVMCSMPAVFAIGVAPADKSACCLAGVTGAALLILGGMIFGKFEEQAPEQPETAEIKS